MIGTQGRNFKMGFYANDCDDSLLVRSLQVYNCSLINALSDTFRSNMAIASYAFVATWHRHINDRND